MTPRQPAAELDPRFSSPGAKATAWSIALHGLESAETYWFTTVRADGRPHATPLIAVWVDHHPFIVTGPDEQKARNLLHGPHDLLATQAETNDGPMDLVIEGDASRLTHEPMLARVAAAYVAKYGEDWRWIVRDGSLYAASGDSGEAWAFAITPHKAFVFAKGETYGQTRYRFAARR
jgi:Pyridoxamine 5'-phosphate oxidase